MTDIFTLGLKADTTDIDRGAKSLDNFADSAEGADKKTVQLREGVNTAGKAIAAFGVTTAAALGTLTVSAANTAREVENLARLSNLTVEEFQRSAFAAKAYGVEQEKLSDILKDTQDKVGDFLTTGGGALVDFFETIAPQVGVTADQFRGLNGKDALQLYISSLEKANVSQSEMVFFLEAIASDATLLQPLLADNGAEFGRLADRADQLGLVLDELDITNLNEMKTSLDELGAISAATSNVIGATLAPFVTDLTNRFNEASIEGGTLRDTIFDLVGAGVTVAGVFADAGRVFEVLGKTIAASVFQIGEEFATIDDRTELALTQFELFADKFDKLVADWINGVLTDNAEFVNNFVNQLDFFNLFDEVDIPAPQIDTSALEANISTLTAEVTQLEDDLALSNKNISDAWQDVIDTLAEPLPSSQFDQWFESIEKTIRAQKKLQQEIKKTGSTAITTVGKTTKAEADFNRKKSSSEISDIKNVLGIAQNALGERSKARKALNEAEKAFTAVEIALSFQKSAANAIEAISAAFAAPWPIGFASGAAMIGIMSGLGLFGGGSGGGGSGNGTGASSTALGGGRSESLADANEDLENIMIDQLAELRGLRGDLNDVNNQSFGLFRQLLNVDPGFKEIRDRTERELRRSFSGLNQGGRGGQFTDELRTIFDSVGEAVDEAVGILGVNTNRAVSDFVFNVGKISFDKLSAEEAEQRLNQILSAQSDLIVQSVTPFITQYQQLGEGALETLVRVAKEQVTFNDNIDRLGISLSELSATMQIDVAQSVIDLTGGMDRFSSLMDEFFDEFFTEAEQFEHLTTSLTEAVEGLGLSMFESRDDFRSMIEGLDLTTEAGQALFAALLELTPAMDEYFDALEDNAVQEAAEAERALEEARRAEAEAAREAAAATRELERAASSAFSALSKAVKAEQSLLKDQLKTDLSEIKTIFDAHRDAVRSNAESQVKLIEGQIANIKTRDELENAAGNAFSRLAQTIAAEQEALQAKSAENLAGIEAHFDGLREDIRARMESQIGSMERQLDTVEGQMSSLASLSGLLGNSISQVVGLGRSQARGIIQDAIAVAQAGGSLAGLDVSGAVASLTNISENQFGSALELQKERARTADQLGELKDLSDGQLSAAERNAMLLESQIETVRRSGENQIEALNEAQAQAEAQEQRRFEAEMEVSNQILEGAREQLDALLGIDSGVLSLEEAQAQLAAALSGLEGADANEALVEVLNTEIEEIKASADRQIEALSIEQALAEEAAQARFDEEFAALEATLENAREQLDALLGIDSSVKTLIEAEALFAESLLALMSDQASTQGAAIADLQAQIKKLDPGETPPFVPIVPPPTDFTTPVRPGPASLTGAGGFTPDEVLKSIAVSSAKTAKLLDRWDGDGQPEIRDVS